MLLFTFLHPECNFCCRVFLAKKDIDLVIFFAISELSFYLKNRDLISNKYAWKKFTGIGKKFLYESHYDFATSIFQTSNIFNPIKDESESLFLILWTHLLRKDYRGAQNFILKEKNGLKTKDFTGPGLFSTRELSGP